MSQNAFSHLIKLADQLPPDQQDRLIDHLRRQQMLRLEQEQAGSDTDPTREMLIKELETLRAAGAFEQVESLYGAFANPNVPPLTADELHDQLHSIATEWEQELDELDRHTP
jgi:hypothetical protein